MGGWCSPDPLHLKDSEQLWDIFAARTFSHLLHVTRDFLLNFEPNLFRTVRTNQLISNSKMQNKDFLPSSDLMELIDERLAVVLKRFVAKIQLTSSLLFVIETYPSIYPC